MAIYSLEHTYIGRGAGRAPGAVATAPGTAGAHLRYITRTNAAEAVISHGMTDAPAAWIDAEEPLLRSNARVLDKLRVAFPAELDYDQRVNLITNFCRSLCTGLDGHSGSWLAALHRPSRSGDDRNFHAHIAVADRHPLTGKRVIGLSAMGQLEQTRALWAEHCNRALAHAGADTRVDHRSYKRQGIEQVPGIHIGAMASAMSRKGKVPRRAEDRTIGGRTAGQKPGQRTIPYSKYPRSRADECAMRAHIADAAQRAARREIVHIEAQTEVQVDRIIAAQEHRHHSSQIKVQPDQQQPSTVSRAPAAHTPSETETNASAIGRHYQDQLLRDQPMTAIEAITQEMRDGRENRARRIVSFIRDAEQNNRNAESQSEYLRTTYFRSGELIENSGHCSNEIDGVAFRTRSRSIRVRGFRDFIERNSKKLILNLVSYYKRVNERSSDSQHIKEKEKGIER